MRVLEQSQHVPPRWSGLLALKIMKRAWRIRPQARHRRLWTRFARRSSMFVDLRALAPAALRFASSQARLSRAFRRSARVRERGFARFGAKTGPSGNERLAYQHRLQHLRRWNCAGEPLKPQAQVSVGYFFILPHLGHRLPNRPLGVADEGGGQFSCHRDFFQSFRYAIPAGRQMVLLPLFLKKGGSIELPCQSFAGGRVVPRCRRGWDDVGVAVF